MRVERIDSTTTVLWRDERLGRAHLQEAAQLQACLTFYGFQTEQKKLPFYAENQTYRIEIQTTDYPCTALITRLPQTPVQEAAWRFAEERLARIIERERELGVLFLDENRFIPFSQLGYDDRRGFYRTQSAAQPSACQA